MQRFRKILSLLTVILLIVLFVVTCILGIMGNENFFGMLALTFFIPIILWVFLFLFRKK